MSAMPELINCVELDVREQKHRWSSFRIETEHGSTAAMHETEMKNNHTDRTNNSGNIEDTNLRALVYLTIMLAIRQ